MAYATQADAEALYGEAYVLRAVDRDEDGKPDLTALTAAFANASNEIDSYASVRYPVPVAPTPSIFVQFCIDIAFYRLAYDPAHGLSDEKQARYDNAIKWLTRLAKGEVSVGAADPAGAAVDLPRVAESPSRVFGRSRAGGLW